MLEKMIVSAEQLAEWERLSQVNDVNAVRQLAEYYHQVKNEELENKYLKQGFNLKEPCCVYSTIADRAAAFVPVQLRPVDMEQLKECADKGYLPAADLLCTYVIENHLYEWGQRALTIAKAALGVEPFRRGVLQCVGSLMMDPRYGFYDREEGMAYLIKAGLNGCPRAGCEALTYLYNDVRSYDLEPAYDLMDALQNSCPDFVDFMRIMFRQWTGNFEGFTAEMAVKAEEGGAYHALLGAYCNLFGIGQEVNLPMARHYMELAPQLTLLLQVYLYGQDINPEIQSFMMTERLKSLVEIGVPRAASTQAALLLGDLFDGEFDGEVIFKLIEQAKKENDPMGWALQAYIYHYGKLEVEKDDALSLKEAMTAIDLGYCPLAHHIAIATGNDVERYWVEFKCFRNYYMRVIDSVLPLKDDLFMFYDKWINGDDTDRANLLEQEAVLGKRLLVESCFRQIV